MNLIKINSNIINILVIIKFFVASFEKKIKFVDNINQPLWRIIT